MMRLARSLLILIMLASIVCGCTSENRNGNFGKHPQLHLRHNGVQGQILLNKFAEAHIMADSIVKLVIKDKSKQQSLITDYGFEYPNWVAHPDDTLPGPALGYKFYYGLLYKGDTIQSTVVTIAPDMRICHNEISELIAYNYFLTGELRIGPRQAMAIAVANGVKENGASMTFHGTFLAPYDTLSIGQLNTIIKKSQIGPRSFYWDIRSQCGGCTTLNVNAADGGVFQKGKTIIIY